jgi:sulfoacetaldehyde dehydrogenase
MSAVSSEIESENAAVDDVVHRARVAQAKYAEGATQERYDQAALAAAWALMEPTRNQALSELAVASTGLGNVPDKITKNHRKTLGLLRDIDGAVTTGVLREDAALGITEYARPKGVIGAVVPSTNPAATPTNNIINALKCGNAIVISPSPKGNAVFEQLLKYMYEQFDKIGLDKDLVQMVPTPSSKIKTQRLMETCDLVVVTGSQDNVRRAYSCGTPAIGVGAGNATVIIDETADLTAAATKIAASKTFDNATSCSSENVLIVVDSVRQEFLQALDEVGGRLLSEAQSGQLKQTLFQGGHLNRHLIAKDIDVFLNASELSVERADSARFVVMPTTGLGPEYPESGEKLSLVVALYAAADFNAAVALASDILSFQGAGHSIGLHSESDDRARHLAQVIPTCRVIVNQAHCFATGGAFNNGMPFSLSMGCGTWGGNSIDDNVNYRHFMNVTKVVRPINPVEPTVESLFAGYWSEVGAG